MAAGTLRWALSQAVVQNGEYRISFSPALGNAVTIARDSDAVH